MIESVFFAVLLRQLRPVEAMFNACTAEFEGTKLSGQIKMDESYFLDLRKAQRSRAAIGKRN
jgi:hypothetical protein